MKEQVKVPEHSHYCSTGVIQSVTLLYFCYSICMVFFERKKGISKYNSPIFNQLPYRGIKLHIICCQHLLHSHTYYMKLHLCWNHKTTSKLFSVQRHIDRHTPLIQRRQHIPNQPKFTSLALLKKNSYFLMVKSNYKNYFENSF